MNIIFFAHPHFLGQQSMPRYASLLATGMQQRGHRVEIWQPSPRFFRTSVPGLDRKWPGYVDQYIVFPTEVKRRLKSCPPDTLFVFADNALGPWMPLVVNRPHVVHCHDFLAQRSALGQISQNPTGWSGRQYQAYIRRGFSQGQHFISVSEKTRDDLHQLLPAKPKTSIVIYNGFNRSFAPICPPEARSNLSQALNFNISDGYILHVGGNQWYKNRMGVIDLYDAWCREFGNSIPLLMIGQKPSPELVSRRDQSLFNQQIHFASGLNDNLVQQAYSGATCLLFPSIAEGFGWPIVEAMACCCPVITTNEAPMTEVGGEAAFYISGKPTDHNLLAAWASEGAKTIHQVVSMSDSARKQRIDIGLENCARFDTGKMLDMVEGKYRQILLNNN